MSDLRRACWAWGALVLCILMLALAMPAHGQADTTICSAFRVIRSSTGRVTTSVAKVACGGTTRVDTVRITRVDTLIRTRVDTVQLGSVGSVREDPRGWNCWIVAPAWEPCIDPTLNVEAYSQGRTLHAGGHTFGYVRFMRNGVISATDPTSAGPPVVVPPPVVVVPPPVIVPPPSTDGITMVQESLYRFGVFQNGVRIGQVAPTGNISVEPWTQWAAWRPRGAGICVMDVSYPTQAAAVAAISAPYTGRDLCAPPLNPPELPRATVDTTMPVTP